MTVEQSCRVAVGAPEAASVTVEVNPFGSESYGVALIVVQEGEGRDRMVCVYDKASGKAEVTAPFADAALD